MATLEDKWTANPWEAFKAGIEKGVGHWDVLTIAIDHGFGGRPQDAEKKKLMLVEEFLEMFSRGPAKIPEQEDIEEFLMEFMNEEFHTDAEDGSVQWIAKLAHTLHRDCMEKQDFTGLARLLAVEITKPIVDADGESSDDEGDDDDDDGDDIDARMASLGVAAVQEEEKAPRERVQPQIDEDGFETVVRKKGNKKR